MQKFKFRLETVLDWRRLHLDRQEAELRKLFGELHRLDAAREELKVALETAQSTVMEAASVEAAELAALETYRYYISRETERLLRERAECEGRIVQQREVVMKAQRDVRLLEKLKERRLAEWTFEANKEQEALAGELFLGRWGRR